MYINPQKNIKINDCHFYHSFLFPDGTEIKGDWDLTQCVKEYLLNFNFNKTKVIDVGSASGFLSFYMESMGADVTSFDMPDGSYWDVLKYPGYKPAIHDVYCERLYNSYNYAHEAFGSNCKIYRANIYNELPEDMDMFDGAVFGTMLSHVRDPMLVLMNILLKVKDFAILINPFPDRKLSGSLFIPNTNHFDRTWWCLDISTIERMVNSIGWSIENVSKVYPIQNVLLDKPKPIEYKSILIKRNS